MATRNIPQTRDAMSAAKNALIAALRAAENEHVSYALRRKIDSLAGKAEALQRDLKNVEGS